MTWRNGALMIAAITAACGGSKGSPVTLPQPTSATAENAEAPAVPAPAAAQARPSADLIPRKILFGNPERANVKISPDGKWLSWLAASNGVMNVWVAPVGELSAARAVTSDTTRPIYSYVWAYDGKHLLYVQDKGGDENWRLHAVDVAAGTVRDLVALDGARVEIYARSHRRPKEVVVGINDRDPKVFDVYRVNLATGKRTLVVKNEQNLAGFHFDLDGNVKLAETMRPDGTNVVLTRDAKNKKNPWKEHDLIGTEDVFTTAIMGFDKKGTAYYVRDSRGRDTSAIFRVDARTKAKTLIHEDAQVDLEEVLMHPTERTIQAVVKN